MMSWLMTMGFIMVTLPVTSSSASHIHSRFLSSSQLRVAWSLMMEAITESGIRFFMAGFTLDAKMLARADWNQGAMGY